MTRGEGRGNRCVLIGARVEQESTVDMPCWLCGEKAEPMLVYNSKVICLACFVERYPDDARMVWLILGRLPGVKRAYEQS